MNQVENCAEELLLWNLTNGLLKVEEVFYIRKICTQNRLHKSLVSHSVLSNYNRKSIINNTIFDGLCSIFIDIVISVQISVTAVTF